MSNRLFSWNEAEAILEEGHRVCRFAGGRVSYVYMATAEHGNHIAKSLMAVYSDDSQQPWKPNESDIAAMDWMLYQDGLPASVQ